MRVISRPALCLLCLAALIGVSDNVSGEVEPRAWESALRQAKIHQNDKAWDPALELAEKAWQLLEDDPEAPKTGRVQAIETLAEICEAKGDLDRAEACYTRNIQISEDAHGPGTALGLKAIDDLAYYFLRRGNYASAITWRKAYRRGLFKAFGARDPLALTALEKLGNAYLIAGEMKEAARHYVSVSDSLYNLYRFKDPGTRRVKDMRAFAEKMIERGQADTRHELALALNGFGVDRQGLGDDREARMFYTRSLELLEETVGQDNADYATVLSNLGTSLQRSRRFDAAEARFKQAQDIYAAIEGKESPGVASSFNRIGVLYRDKGYLMDAENYLHQAHQMWKKTRGPDHPDVAIGLNNLGVVFLERGKIQFAEFVHKDALKIREARLGPSHPATAESLHNLARVYQKRGAHETARDLYKRAYAIRLKSFGPEHPLTVDTEADMGRSCTELELSEEADRLLTHALSARTKSLGPDEIMTAMVMSDLGVLRRYTQKFQEAIKLHERSLSIFQSHFGEHHAYTAASTALLAKDYEQAGRTTEAEGMYLRAIEIGEGTLGRSHPDVAEMLLDLGAMYLRTNRRDTAIVYFTRSHRAYVLSLGLNDPRTRGAKELLRHAESKRPLNSPTQRPVPTP